MARPAAVWRERWAALQAAGWPCLVGVLDDAVIGFGYAGPWRPQAAYRHTVETTVYLDADHTGAGHGGALLAAVLERAAANGARQAIAVIADGNPGSVALHRRHGFAEVGTLRGVGEKFGREIDTALFQSGLRP